MNRCPKSCFEFFLYTKICRKNLHMYLFHKNKNNIWPRDEAWVKYIIFIKIFILIHFFFKKTILLYDVFKGINYMLTFRLKLKKKNNEKSKQLSNLSPEINYFFYIYIYYIIWWMYKSPSPPILFTFHQWISILLLIEYK